MRVREAWKIDGERITPDQMVSVMRPGATVFLEQGSCEPMLLHRALLGLSVEIQLLAVPIAGLNECEFANTSPPTRLNAKVFAGCPSMSKAMKSGSVEYVPSHWSEIMPAMRTRFRPDVALLQVSPPDSDGYCNLGGNACFEQELASIAETVIAEINPNIPAVLGDTAIHQSDIDFYVLSEEPMRSIDAVEFGDAEMQIARHVASLIPEGSTLQIGTGRVPDAVLGELYATGRQVRFHSGIFTDAMMRMTAARPATESSPVVAGMLMGSRELYRFANQNPDLSLRNSDFTHSTAVISGIERFISINSAIEIDLLGQVNAEFVDGRQVAGVGGQLDFFRGARRSPGGRSIIAMPSCTRTRSRIVRRLEPGVPVTSSRADFDFVVTEYGVAEMRNCTEQERAQALIAIAAPQHRRELQ